jgi:hypothetical protein
MLGKLHAHPGDEEQGTKSHEESTAKNCSKYQVQSVSPIELPEAFHPSHDYKAASAVFTGPKLAGRRWVGGFFAPRFFNSVWLVHFSTDSIVEIAPRLPSLEACHH